MKKAKKIIIPVVLALCLCAACVLLFVNYRESRKFQPPINGISWGMTSDEVIKKLNLSQENVKVDENGDITLSYENATFFNQKANVNMTFDMQTKMNLLRMIIDFQDLNEDDLINQLNNTYGQYVQVDGNQIVCGWVSEKVIDLPQEIQDRFKYVRIGLPSKYNISLGFSEEGMWEREQKYPLVYVQLIDSSLYYNANYMAAYTILKDDKKYNAWVEYIENLLKNRPNQDSIDESKLPVG